MVVLKPGNHQPGHYELCLISILSGHTCIDAAARRVVIRTDTL
jgi:hypothetical protein